MAKKLTCINCFHFFPFNSGSTMVAASATGILEAGLLLLVARKQDCSTHYEIVG